MTQNQDNFSIEDLKQIIELSSDLICVASFEGYFIKLSPAWEKLLGWTNEELKAKPLIEFVHNEDYAQTIYQSKQVNDGHRAIKFINRYMKKNGTYVWLEWNVFSDNIQKIKYAIARDRSEEVELEGLNREKIQQQAHRWNLLTKIAPVGIFETDADGKCKFVNDQLLKMSGRQEHELLGEGWIKAVHPDDVENVYYEWGESVRTDKDYFLEYRFKKPNGEVVWVIGKSISLKNDKGNIVGFVGSVQEITKLKEIQNELIETNKIADQSAKAKSEFLSSMSHEIRTPMNGVIGVANLLLDTNLTTEQKEYTQTIINAGDMLVNLINDILDISKIDSGKLLFEKSAISIDPFLNETIKLLSPIAEKKSINIKLNTETKSISYSGDAGRIRQILINLIGNAIKFTEKGQVVINQKIWKSENDNIGIIFEIIDSGIGISKEAQEKLFENFVQANNKIQAKYGGTGLGLSISKKLAEMMGGKIEVESELNKGSIFRVFLKLDQVAHEIENNKDIIPEKNIDTIFLKDKKILIVEDNSVNQMVIKRVLQKYEVAIFMANNGREAVDSYISYEFDLILMDCLMPEVDGFEATEIIRVIEKGRNKKIPIIAMTAYAMEEDRQKCLESGMNDFLTKPINTKSILKCLHHWLVEKKNEL